jgi:hypothetical protein
MRMLKKKTAGNACVRRSRSPGHCCVLFQHLGMYVANIPCKQMCHEFCFEAKCKRTVVRRNLVGKIVVLMPNIMYSICAMKLYSFRIRPIDLATVLLKQLFKLLSLPCSALLPDLPRTLTRPSPHSYPTYRLRARISHFLKIIL